MFLKLTLLSVILKCLFLLCESSLSDVTASVFKSSADGIVAAFGDFDADKSTDLFIVSNDGKNLTLQLGHTDTTPTVTETPFKDRTILDKDDTKDMVITSVVPADFDGDSMMDVMITLQKKDEKTTDVKVRIYWGNSLNVDRGSPLNLNETFHDQPTLVDANGDMIPDLLGENVTTRAFWIFTEHRNYTVLPITNNTSTDLPPLKVPQASAFLDFNQDMAPDLVVMSVNADKKAQFEIWYNKDGEFAWNETIPVPDEAKVPGHPTFIDMDGNHHINIVLPSCSDDQCTKSMIHVWSENKWHKLNVNFKSGSGTQWNFVPMSDRAIPWLQIPPILRAGDFNLNSYPDAVAVLTAVIDGNKTYGAFFLENVHCGSDCDDFSQTFSISLSDPLVSFSRQQLQAAFFDLNDNGVLDILVNTVSSKRSHITALKQIFSEDACFMKVMVVSGRCNEDCPNGHKPYGVNQVGPVVRFQTTTADGDQQVGVGSQLTQTAYFSLQLPFVHFGLGQMPNFVEKLEVGLQYPPGKSKRYKDWTQIIPNSQLVIIPHPPDQSSSWVLMLFVTPSRLVLLTGAALLGTCGFIAGIVGILHWRERVEDKKEKLQEAHKFHFDAM